MVYPTMKGDLYQRMKESRSVFAYRSEFGNNSLPGPVAAVDVQVRAARAHLAACIFRSSPCISSTTGHSLPFTAY